MLIGLSGFARSGKDTAADFLVEYRGFEKRAFAGALKEMLRRLNPIIDGHLDLRLRDVVDQHGWEIAKQISEVRELLQRLGTEAGREVLGDDIWVRTALRNLPSQLCISDCRFPNEMHAIRAAGGVVVRINRPGLGPVNDHPSETALMGYTPDYTIENDGSLDELCEKVLLIADKGDDGGSYVPAYPVYAPSGGGLELALSAR